MVTCITHGDFFIPYSETSNIRSAMDNTDDAPPPPYTERRPLLPSSKPQSTGVHTAIPIYGASFIPIKQSTIQHTREPRDYLTLSILSTIFCCCSIGILAIVKSSRAREANLIGQYYPIIM